MAETVLLAAGVLVLVLLVGVVLWVRVGKARRPALPIDGGAGRPAAPAPARVPPAAPPAAPRVVHSAQLTKPVLNLEMRRLIAEGGMGQIYEAFDPVLHRRVAIKKMRPEISADSAGRELFLKEARIVAGLRHPNIVEIFSVVDAGGELCLVFEYLEGTPLDDLLQAGPLPAPECRRILGAVCAALEFAHGRQVLHRDLKPANVMVGLQGDVKVMDFGIARQAATTLSRLSPGSICGTLSYMAPEQHLGVEKRPADLYALGVTAYQMLTGRLPFGEDRPLPKKERMEFASPSSLMPGAGAEADAFMAKALASKPENRFGRAAEFLEAFDRVWAA